MSDQNQQSTLLGKIAAYTEILVKDPKSTIFVSLAETYRKMGMFEDSRQIIEKGLELHPDFSPAHIVLARVHCQLENFDASEEAFKHALAIDPDSLAALVGYARVKILLGHEDEARELLLRARELSPADPVINKLLLSLPEEAMEGVESEETEDADGPTAPLISQTLAELYLKQGLKEDALNVYHELLAKTPDDLALRRKIKDIENELPDVEDVELDQPMSDQVEDLETPDTEPSESPDNLSVPIPDETEGAESARKTDAQDTDELVLGVLNQWLTQIEQRRKHV